MLIFALYFTSRLVYFILSLLGRGQMDPRCPSCFWVKKSRQDMPVSVKTISSWVRKVLSIAMDTIQGASVSAALAASVTLVSILQSSDWGRVSTSARNLFFLTYTDQHQYLVQHAALGFSE